jgi:Caspase domain
MIKLIISALTLASSLLFVSLSSDQALADRRVALVIGNSQYKNASLTLPNPKNDAEDIAASLRTLGFEVVLATDADKTGLEQAMQQFARRVTDADSALFYYAGHAMQYQGRNYLMPVDAELEDEISLRYQMIAIDDVRAALDRANGVKIMILDACRNNPLADRLARTLASQSRNVGNVRGLARVDKTQGMVVAYATAADDVAQDGTGRNSPYTTALLKRMQEPGVEVEIMFRRVTADVNAQTFGRQRPETYISLLSEYYLNQSDKALWEQVKDSGDVAAIRDFVTKFPSSTYTAQAQTKLAALDRTVRDNQTNQADREKAQGDAANLQTRLAALEAERTARERAERERVERERADRERAERERAEREAAERTRLARLETERLAAEREAAERTRLARLEAERKAEEACKRDEERLAGLQRGGSLERDQLVRFERDLACDRLRPLVVAAIAGLAVEAPKTRVVPPPALLMDTPQLVSAAQVELRRIGCFAGDNDGKLTEATRNAIKRYLTVRGLPSTDIKVSESLVAELKTQDKSLCPLDCKRGEVAENGRCVAAERVAEPRRSKKTTKQTKQATPHERTAAPAARTRENAPINQSPPQGPSVGVAPVIGIGRFGRFGVRF